MVADGQRGNNFIWPTPRLNIELISDQRPRQILCPLAVFFANVSWEADDRQVVAIASLIGQAPADRLR
jgi:hypothetical protein